MTGCHAQSVSTARRWALRSVHVLALIGAAAAACGSTHPYVGFSAPFTGFEHEFAGTIHILDDCTFSVSNFTYDGLAPAVHWWGAPSVDAIDANGVQIAAGRVTDAAAGQNVTLKLLPDQTWDVVGAVALWCSEFKADFGHVALRPPPARPASTACSRTHPYVGFRGRLTGLEHEVAGTVSIVDDCTFRVSNFTYDGYGPAVYWWGAPNATAATLEKQGKVIVGGGELPAASNGNVTLKLKEDDEWDDIGAIALWCTDYDADFGHVELEAAPAVAHAAALAAAPPAGRLPAPSRSYGPPPAAPPPLPNCAPLTGRYRVHWQLDDPDPAAANNIRMALEARVPANHWMGFGMNSASLTEVLMPGSDVVVAGMTGDNEGFAIDYYLNEREQCNYATGGDVGVCPDNSQLNSTTANNVRMLFYSNTDGVIKVEFTRPLKPSDAADKRWVVTEARPITWAMGPLSEASTNTTPIVLFHQINGEPVNAPLDFKLHLGRAQNGCSGPIGGSSARDVPGNVSTLANVTTFAVTTGPNPNYPNPPAWGLSYHLNGDESPLIRVVRGTKYTFKVMASPQHPFYLTSSKSGGAGRKVDATEKLFAGGANSSGTAAAPFSLSWTPNATTPDSLYYQCHTHQKLGWRVEVFDAGDPRGLSASTAAATATAAPAKNVVAAGALPAPEPATDTQSAAAPEPAATPAPSTETTVINAAAPATAPAPAPQMAYRMLVPGVIGGVLPLLLLGWAGAAVLCA